MLDLFEIARKNAPLLAQRLEDVKATKAAGDVALLERFANRVQQHGRVAINMRTSELSDLLLRGRYYNIYEWSQEQAVISKRPANAIQRERLGDYFEKRMAFDGAFVDGQKFRYGTLTLGGAGPVEWGQFCAVLKAEFAESASRLAYVRGDSLNTYSDISGNIDVSAVTRDAAPHSSRHALAAIKHADEVSSTPAAEWPDLLCSNSDYIEAIMGVDVTSDSVKEVRITQDEKKTLWDLAFADFGRKLEPGERALTHDFATILRETNARGIPIIEV
ncbi:MAG: hypothetical protein L0387_04820 [Acidobacteria bacterium]|nr:hypothetical protein [Acidobacteriota bacterium]